jgi:hypothetical protein
MRISSLSEYPFAFRPASTDYRFDMKTFTELKNAQAIVMAYDGLNPLPPTFCYLKPYFNDPRAMALAQEGNSVRPAGQEMCSLQTKRY